MFKIWHFGECKGDYEVALVTVIEKTLRIVFFSRNYFAICDKPTNVCLSMTIDAFSFKIEMLDLSRGVVFHGNHAKRTCMQGLFL